MPHVWAGVCGWLCGCREETQAEKNLAAEVEALRKQLEELRAEGGAEGAPAEAERGEGEAAEANGSKPTAAQVWLRHTVR